MEQRRCSINPLELQEKLYEEGIDIEQKGSDNLIFWKNEREKKQITGVMYTDSEKLRATSSFYLFIYIFLNGKIFMHTDSSKKREFLISESF